MMRSGVSKHSLPLFRYMSERIVVKTQLLVMAVMCCFNLMVIDALAEPAYVFEDLPGPMWRGGFEVELYIHDPQGEPAAHAKLQVASEIKTGYLVGDGPPHPERVPSAEADGRFRFVLPEKPAALVITHESGLAIVEPQTLFTPEGVVVVAIQPWATVEGRLVDAQGKPIPDAEVTVQVGHWLANAINPMLDSYPRGRTDAAGRFHIPYVVPGEVRVSHRLIRERRNGPRFILNASCAVGRAEAGQVLTLDVGGGGQTIKGLLDSKALYDVPLDYHGANVWVTSRYPQASYQPGGSKPPGWSTWPKDKRRAWRAAWNHSLQRFDYERNNAQLRFVENEDHFGTVVKGGGFSIKDVPAGQYTLTASLGGGKIRAWSKEVHEILTNGTPSEKEKLMDALTAEVRIEIPVDVGLQTGDTPIDVGTWSLSRKEPLAVGDIFPDFSATALPAKIEPSVLRLQDFRGQYVLLDFWATWCGPCLGEAPHFAAVQKKYGNDDRLVWLSISIDVDHQRPSSYIDKLALGGAQAWMSAEQIAARNEAFYLPHIPSIWLIGPDGTILFEELRGERITAVVEDVLGEPSLAE